MELTERKKKVLRAGGGIATSRTAEPVGSKAITRPCRT